MEVPRFAERLSLARSRAAGSLWGGNVEVGKTRAVCALAVGLWLGLAVTVRAGEYTVLIDDNLQSYASHSAFKAVWTDTYRSEYVLDLGFGNAAPSLRMPLPSSNFNGRFWRNLGGKITPNDGLPLTFTFDMHLDAAGAPGWNNARHYCELRGYSGGSYGQGSLQSLVAMGIYNGSGDAFSTLKYQGRLYSPGLGDAWYTLDAEASAPNRTAGWRHMKIVVTTSQVRFYIDNQLAEVVPRNVAYPFDTVVLGSDLTANGHEVYVDNVRVTGPPPPPPCPDPVFDVVGGGPEGLWPDGAVDLKDFGIFQACFTGSNPPAGAFDPLRCGCFDRNGDLKVDSYDLLKFQACWTGPAPAVGALDPACDD